MSHTKGPWSASGLGIYAHDASTDGDVMVANCDDVDKRPQGEAEANARLIAAAPELLNALTNLLERIDCDPFRDIAGVPSGIRRAKNAIAKAEGKS